MDRDDYHKLKSNHHPVIVPLVKTMVRRLPPQQSNKQNGFAQLGLRADGNCGLLDADRLCLIQKTVGSPWMPTICRTYPRISREIDGNLETSLGLSCPEVAQLALSQSQSIQFVNVSDEGVRDSNISSRLKFDDPSSIDIRNLCIVILQTTTYSIDTRMLLLSEFLSGIDQLVLGKRIDLIPELVSSTIKYLSGEHDYTTEASRYPINLEARLRFVGDALTVLFDKKPPRVFAMFVSGFMEGFGISKTMDIETLVNGYHAAYTRGGRSFLKANDQVFENYLVSLVFTNAIALHYKEPYQAYRSYLRLVLTYSMIKLLAIGIAAHPAGAEKKDLVALIYSFSRHAEHNQDAITKLLQHVTQQGNGTHSFIATILREAD
jgi:lysine-N-methylase